MSESKEYMAQCVRETRDRFRSAKAARRLRKASKGDPATQEVLRALHRRLRAQAIGMLLGVIVSLPVYFVNRTMEVLGVVPILFILGTVPGVVLWYFTGDRASGPEFVLYAATSAASCMMCIFTWAATREGADDE